MAYALGIHPLSIRSVERRAKEADVSNVRTILSNGASALPGGSVDDVFLYDVLHSADDTQALLVGICRVLKLGGHFLVRPDHMTREELLEKTG